MLRFLKLKHVVISVVAVAVVLSASVATLGYARWGGSGSDSVSASVSTGEWKNDGKDSVWGDVKDGILIDGNIIELFERNDVYGESCFTSYWEGGFGINFCVSEGQVLCIRFANQTLTSYLEGLTHDNTGNVTVDRANSTFTFDKSGIYAINVQYAPNNTNIQINDTDNQKYIDISALPDGKPMFYYEGKGAELPYHNPQN